MNQHEEQQYLLDWCYNEMMAQGMPSLDRNGHCVYRSDGLGCAAAVFITAYQTGMEGMSFCGVADEWPDAIEPIALRNADFVEEVLQPAHDAAAVMSGDFRGIFRNELKRYAEYHTHLTMPWERPAEEQPQPAEKSLTE